MFPDQYTCKKEYYLLIKRKRQPRYLVLDTTKGLLFYVIAFSTHRRPSISACLHWKCQPWIFSDACLIRLNGSTPTQHLPVGLAGDATDRNLLLPVLPYIASFVDIAIITLWTNPVVLIEKKRPSVCWWLPPNSATQAIAASYTIWLNVGVFNRNNFELLTVPFWSSHSLQYIAHLLFSILDNISDKNHLSIHLNSVSIKIYNHLTYLGFILKPTIFEALSSPTLQKIMPVTCVKKVLKTTAFRKDREY